MNELRAYMVSAGDSDAALLVFARNVREARVWGWPWIQGWYSDAEYIDVRARWLRGGCVEHRVPELHAKGEPYVVEAPDSCRTCGCWHDAKPNAEGECEDCAEATAEWRRLEEEEKRRQANDGVEVVQ